MTLPSTQYGEPCIRQGNDYQGNATSAYRNGYTLDDDLASFMTGYRAHAKHWSPLGVATNVAFSPFQAVAQVASTAKAGGDASTTIGLMGDMVRTLGRMSVLGNNGFRNPAPETQDKDYAAMYAAQFAGAAQSPPVPITYQTKSLNEMQSHRREVPTVSLPNTVRLAVDVKATGVELPVGCTQKSSGADYLSSQAARRLNATFADNVARCLKSRAGSQ